MLHLLRRTTYGITPELLTEVHAAGGAQGWLERQLDPANLNDAVSDAVLYRFPLGFATPPKIHAAVKYGAWDAMTALVRATVCRQVWSKRQLFEVMVEFWSNHLNVTCPSSEAWSTKPWDDIHVIRANAMRRFDDMLAASVTSPAMLLYLDNASSKGNAPNENYGREFLELHTVGVNAGYTQDDVINAARAFSGLTVWNPWNGGTAGEDGNYGTFRYRADWHYVGPLKVMGWTHPNGSKDGGQAVAESLARYLAHHPATAQRIAHKLCIRFVSDNPPKALVDRLAQVYLTSQTAIVPVLRALFASPEFAASVGQKTRRPGEDIVATLRAVGATPDTNSSSTKSISNFTWAMEDLGNAPMGWHPPNGYPDVAPAWLGAGTTLRRWTYHLGATQQWWKDGVVYPKLTDHLLGPSKPTTRGALVDALLTRLLPGQTVKAEHRTALITFLGGDGPTKDGDFGGLFPVLVALVLDSPYWSVR